MEKISLNKGQFVTKYRKEIQKDYQLYNKLGEDYYSDIYKACKRKSKIRRCIKHYKTKLLAQTDIDYIKSEIHYLKILDHPNIMKITEIYEHKHHLYVVCEFLNGKPLFERLSIHGKLDEYQAASVMYQLLHAVAYLHSMGIAHRDIKPEYVIFENESPCSILRITDLKSALRLKPGKKFKKHMGTPYYMAPEVIKGSYDLKCDIWSCGVLLYVMLSGYAPFNSTIRSDILLKVKQGTFTFPEKDWSSISNSAKELITSMLTYDPEKRPEASVLLDHQWFKEKWGCAPTDSFKLHTIKNMEVFKPKIFLRTAILLYLVSKLDIDMQEMVYVFYALDKNHKGYLTANDLKESFERDLGKEKAEMLASNIMSICDLNHTDTLSFSEFMICGFNFNINMDTPKLKNAFDCINLNGTGELDFNDLKNFFNFKHINRSELVLEILNQADMNKDKKISFDEFIELMEGYYNTRGVSVRKLSC